MNVILPLSIIPPVPYFTAALSGHPVQIDLGEHYQHQTIRNRYHILGPNGVVALTVNVKSQHGIKTPSAQVEIDYQKAWQRSHIRTLQAAYGSAPFYAHYMGHIIEILSGNEKSLGELFMNTWPKWLKLLRITPHADFSDFYLEDPVSIDFRDRIKAPHWFDGRIEAKEYMQVFMDRSPFVPHLSILDLLFNEGPAAAKYMQP